MRLRCSLRWSIFCLFFLTMRRISSAEQEQTDGYLPENVVQSKMNCEEMNATDKFEDNKQVTYLLRMPIKHEDSASYNFEIINQFGVRKSSNRDHFQEDRDFDELCEHFVADFDNFRVQATENSLRLQLLHLSSSFAAEFDNWLLLLQKIGFSSKTVHLASKIRMDKLQIGKIRNLFEAFFSQRASLIVKNGVATVVGEYIILSHFADQLQNNDTIQEIALIATKKIFIDCDLVLLSKHLTIVGPNVEIVDVVREITMKGDDAVALEQTKAANTAERGANGRDGYSSGRLTIASLNIEHPELLVLNTFAGNGSAGQDGSDGTDDVVPDLPAYPFTLSGNQSFIISKLREFYGEVEIEFEEGYMSSKIVVTKKGGVPKNGMDGGDGGAGADVGDRMLIIMNSTSVNQVLVNVATGSAAEAGRGGVAKADSFSITTKIFKCASLIFMPLYHCDNYNTSVQTIDVEVNNGKHGQQDLSHRINYRIQPKYELSDAVKVFCSCAVKTLRSLSRASDTFQFLDFIATNTDVINLMNIEAYYQFLDIASINSFVQDSKMFSNIEAVLISMYGSFTAFALICDNCEAMKLEELNILFVSRLNYLQSLTINQQTVNLKSEKVELQSLLSNIKSSSGMFPMFDEVEYELLSVQDKVKMANGIIINVQKIHVPLFKEELDLKLERLMNLTRDLQNEKEESVETRKEYSLLEETMLMKAALGTVQVFMLFARLLFPSAAVVEEVLRKKHTFTKQSDNEEQIYKAANFSWSVNEALQAIAEYKEHRKRANLLRRNEQVKALKAAADAGEIIVNVGQLNTFKYLVDLYLSTFAADSGNTHLQSILFRYIIEILGTKIDEKIKKMEGSNGPLKTINRLKNSAIQMKIAQQVSQSGSAVIEMLSTYGKEKANWELIASINEPNLKTLQEIARYEQELDDQFLPMIDSMLPSLMEIQSDQNDTSLLLQLEKANVKEHARSFVTMMKKFTRDFVIEGNGIDTIMVQLEEFMSILINSYDKLNALKYRVQLKDLWKRISQDDCINNKDSVICSRIEKLDVQISIDEKLRRFLFLLNTEYQSSFPFPSKAIDIVRNTFARLTNSSMSIEAVDKILETSLDDVTFRFEDEEIMPSIDTHIMFAHFSDQSIIEPFYTWPNAKYAKQIQKLLSGEQVTLSAPVFSPRVRNVVKFSSLLLNITSANPMVNRAVRELLDDFQVEMVHLGESNYKCGANYYVIGSAPLVIRTTFKNSEQRTLYDYENMVYGKRNLSPYTVWKFKLIQQPNKDRQQLLEKLQSFANCVDLKLVGTGTFISEDAPICDLNLDQFYQNFSG